MAWAYFLYVMLSRNIESDVISSSSHIYTIERQSYKENNIASIRQALAYLLSTTPSFV